MKKHLFASTAAALLLAASAAHAAPYADSWPSNWYVSVLGGATYSPHLSVGGASVGLDNGFNGGARVGTYLSGGSPFSIEADTFYNQSDYSGSGARLETGSLMGDVVYHLNPMGPVNFYGGAGVGAVDTHYEGAVSGVSTVLGWQALAGAEVAVSPDMNLFTEYRYQNAHDANIAGIAGVGNTSNNLSVGLKFSL